VGIPELALRGNGATGLHRRGEQGWIDLGFGRRGAYRILRKEVIQPQVPLRLPCYDFVPLTGHTFDASPPCGLGQRLRVQQTQVT
jgi:hypothetical protein